MVKAVYALLSVAAASDTELPNIVELAESVKDLSTLVSAVVAGDLADTLSSPGPFTVFAPTNEAFAALPKGTLDNLMKPENKKTLVDVLTYHVLPAQVLYKDIKEGLQAVETVEGKNVLVHKKGHHVFVGPSQQDFKTVTAADNLASNGVAHIVNGVLLPPALLSATAAAVDLVTFDDASNWKTLIDPVMGGQSTATATVTDGHGILDGEVKIVPSLQAPGFITAQADMKIDASAGYGGDLVMKVRSTTPEYTGFKVSFAASTTFATLACASGGSTALGRGCFKAPFSVAAGDDFSEVRIPLSEFSDKWSSATGELTTLCKDDPSVCPTAEKLKKVQRVAIWGEGAAGKVHVELDSISIESPSGESIQLV